MQWLADASNLSLDWQELPPDYVNLVTDKRYTLTEARDLFNRQLLARGYTMVLQGQVLSVFKIDKLEPSLLPRIEDEAELLDLPAHDFVKITFELPDKLKADQVAKDIKPLLSPHAKIQPLLSTNRLLVIGAVANLRGVSRLLNAEHAAAREHIVPKEFLIKFARADYVADQVMILLGLDPASRRTPQELQLEQKRLQLFTQMQQKGKDVTKFLRKDGPAIFLTVNARRNSILVNAPPAEMEVIERSIASLDRGDPNSAATNASTPLRTAAARMQTYTLVTRSPQSVVTALEQIGELEPRTQLNIDEGSKTIFAYATPADHEKIQSMIDGLDGTGREFEVIWLRRLPADRVAATIHALMVGEEEKQQTSRYSYYSYRYNRQEEKKPNEGFRIDADVENNRLLLWATEAELKEVNKFLAKLGEIPGGGKNPNTVRMLDPREADATMRILEQLRQAWPTLGNNQLIIEGAAPTDRKDEKEGTEEQKADVLLDNPSTTQMPTTSSTTRYVQLSDDANAEIQPQTQQTANSAPNAPPPVRITVSEDGRIMISSKDTEALDKIEELLAQVAPPAKDFEVFYLKYAFASSVVANLKEFFTEEGTFNTEDNWWRAWMGMSFQEDADAGTGLSSRRSLRFISDFDTNSILVSNASPGQLATVKRLIEIYDKAPSEDSISARRFWIKKLKNAKANKVAITLKEVYRDLLSSKDKEFSKDPKQQEKSSQSSYVRVYGGVGSGSQDDKPTKVRQSFAGALSVGVDEVTNTVIISVQEEWLSSIKSMVEYLDTEAEPSLPTVSYGKMPKNFRGERLTAILNAIISDQDPKQPGDQADGEKAEVEVQPGQNANGKGKLAPQ